VEEALRAEVLERGLQRILLVEERNQEPRFAQRAGQQIGIERGRRHALLLREPGGEARSVADFHRDGLEPHRAPRDVRRREAQRHEQVVHALRQQRAIGNLAGARFLG